jgi:capsular exopolysaccharide synthesis family protein
MSRVHDALRRADTSVPVPPAAAPPAAAPPASPAAAETPALQGLLEQIEEVPWNPAPGAHLIDATRPEASPTEEFRSLRTRLNHLQGQQPLHTIVVTSASPAEGKSFSASNLALVESHLAGSNTLLCDFDFRRPILHNLFNLSRSPGLTDYLQGKASLGQVIKRIQGTNLYVMPAGGVVVNPLELLNLREVKVLLDRLPTIFNWVILDTPPLLFAADANLLSTYCDGTLMVVRLGQTTVESVTRAMQGLSHNNVIGVICNGAARGELYSKYSYYEDYYGSSDKNGPADDEEELLAAAARVERKGRVEDR